MSSLPFSSTLFRPGSGGLTAAGPVLCPVSLDKWLLASTLGEVLGVVGAEVGVVGVEVGSTKDKVEVVADEAAVEDEVEV